VKINTALYPKALIFPLVEDSVGDVHLLESVGRVVLLLIVDAGVSSKVVG